MAEAPEATPTIELKPAATQVVEILRQWILSGRMAGGECIRQEALAADLGVSRVPVREALVALESEGLIVREKYKGAFVAEISLSEVKETYALRELLELFLLENALPHISEQDLCRAEATIVQSMETPMGPEWARLNLEFHKILYEPAELVLTMRTFETVLRRTERYFRLQQAVVAAIGEESCKQHQIIVDRIRSGDHEAALEVMRHHIRHNAGQVIEYLESQQVPDSYV